MKVVRLKRKQRGATFLGMLIIVGILLFAVYGGIRLVPLYQENMAVVNAMQLTASQLSSGATPAAIRESLAKRWVVEDIKSIKPADIEINKSAGRTTMRANYEAKADFVANVSLLVTFDKTVSIGGDIP